MKDEALTSNQAVIGKRNSNIRSRREPAGAVLEYTMALGEAPNPSA